MRLPYKENLEDIDLEIEVAELLKETKLDVENIVILPINKQTRVCGLTFTSSPHWKRWDS